MDDDDFVHSDRKVLRKRAGGGGGEVFADINFPQGHCLVHQRWKSTPLAKQLDKVMSVHLYDGMGPVDFQPAPNVSVIYLGESDLLPGKASGVEKVKERVMQAEEGIGGRSNLKVFCVFLKSPLSLPHLANLQVFHLFVFLSFCMSVFLSFCFFVRLSTLFSLGHSAGGSTPLFCRLDSNLQPLAPTPAPDSVVFSRQGQESFIHSHQ